MLPWKANMTGCTFSFATQDGHGLPRGVELPAT